MASVMRSYRKVIVTLVLSVSIAAHFVIGLRMMRQPKIDFGDGIEYLNAAYHLHRTLTYTSSPEPDAPPAIGREPGYPVFLALLMSLETRLASYDPGCSASGACDPGRFRLLSIANLVLIEITGLLLFTLVRGLTGGDGLGLAAAGYVLLNVNLLRFHWFDPMSDSLAMALVTLAMLALQRAWGRDATMRWCCVGLAFAVLTLTKAVFLPFSLGIAAWAAFQLALTSGSMRRWGRGLVLASVVYATLVGGWVARNWHVAGVVRFTDDRGGIALSTREVFDHMTPAQWAAAFVYWTPGGGEALARHLFASDTLAPFDLYAPGGFYDRGQNGYARRVDSLKRAEGIDTWQATRAIDRTIVREILAAPLGYAVSTFPLLYRGLWIDQFALLTFPLLLWTLWRAMWERRYLVGALLSFGFFNELFYALFSLNIPRYQMTAVPTLAVVGALGCATLMSRLRRPTALDGTLLLQATARSDDGAHSMTSAHDQG